MLKRTLIFAVIIAGFPAAGYSQVITKPLGSEPGLNWRLATEIAYDDNVFRTLDPFAESDTYLAVRPELAWYGFSGANHFDLTLGGNFRRYQDQDLLDFDAWNAQGHALLDHTLRLTSELQLGYEEGVQQIGTLGQIGIPTISPNTFDLWNAEWELTYGAADATGQLVGRARYREQEFTNNEQQFRDVDTTDFSGTFYYRIAPRTRLLFEVIYTDFVFVNQDAFGNNQSGDEIQYLSGVTWEATGKTTGSFRIGYRDRSFDNTDFENLTGLALGLNMTWQPSDLTTVTLGADRNNQSAALQGVGGFVRTGVNASLIRSVSARARLVADANYQQNEFERFAGRTDDLLRVGAGLEYDLGTRLSARLEYRREERDSTLELSNFSSNIILLTFTLTPPS